MSTKIIIAMFAGLCMMAGSAFAQIDADFSYSYGNPMTSEAKIYITSQNNVNVRYENPVYYWCPAGPGPGEIVMEFDFPQNTGEAYLLAKMPTFNWSYGKGHNYLYGSKDGSDWSMLMEVQPPNYGEANSGVYNGALPDDLMGVDKLFLKFVLSTTSTGTGVWQNIAEFSRWDRNYPDSKSFVLEVAYAKPVPVPAAVWLLGSGLLGFALFRKKIKKS